MRLRTTWVVAAAWCLCMNPAEAGERVLVRPADNGAELANPGMGWVLHYYDNVPSNYGSRLKPSDTLDGWPGLTVIYLRIPWSYIEPEEGKFHWSILDTPAQRWIGKGKQLAFRISVSESWTRWATPKWVADAGAKGYNFLPGKGVQADGPFWEPDFDDPVFLAKLDRFLGAMAARYDGNPEVAFVDVGSLGVWGEGHTWSSTLRPIATATVKRHIDLHKKHFRKTLLAANDDMGGSDARGRSEAIDYAAAQGLTLRDDSILVQAGKNACFHAAWAEAFWPKVPVILESEHYGGSKARGCWQDGSLYLKAVEEYHASYVSIHWWPHEFLEETRPLVRQINQRLGYRLQLTEAGWPKAIRLGDRLTVRSAWRNAGVASCLPGAHPIWTLKDSQGGITAVLVDDAFDARSLPVAAPGKAPAPSRETDFGLPFQLRTGRYDVFVSMGSRTGTPTIALPLAGDDGQRRYRLGTVEITGDYSVRAGELQRRGNGYYLPLAWTIRNPLREDIRPFCHFDADGKIAFQGLPENEKDMPSLAKPGTVALGCVFNVPEESRGRQLTVHVGLWSPSLGGKGENVERAIPDEGELDRRVGLGRLTVGQDGTAIMQGR